MALADYATWTLPTQTYDPTDRDLTAAQAQQLLASGGMSPQEIYGRLRPGEIIPPQLRTLAFSYTQAPQPTTVTNPDGTVTTTPAPAYTPPPGAYASQAAPLNWWEAPTPPPNLPTLPPAWRDKIQTQWYNLAPAGRQQLVSQAFSSMYGDPVVGQQELAKFHQSWLSFAAQNNMTTMTPNGYQAPIPTAEQGMAAPGAPVVPASVVNTLPPSQWTLGMTQNPAWTPAPVTPPGPVHKVKPPHVDHRTLLAQQQGLQPMAPAVAPAVPAVQPVNPYTDPNRFRPKPEHTIAPDLDPTHELKTRVVPAPTPLRIEPTHAARRAVKPGFALARPKQWGA